MAVFIEAEHGGMLRRMQVQTDDVCDLGFEVGIVAGQITLQSVRLQADFFPHAMHGILAHSQRRRQFATAPMRGAVARFLAGGGENPGPQRRSQHRRLLAGMIGVNHRSRIGGSAVFSE
jgi:hypothetical protein